MDKQKCVQCGANTKLGEIRSGLISFGAYFVEFEEEKSTMIGTHKPKPGIRKNNRVVSYACMNCGFISSYLEDIYNGAKSSARQAEQP